jgi:hypothetical protein
MRLRYCMRFRYWMSAAVLVSALLLMIDAAAAFDDSLYPDLKGQWRRLREIVARG